MDEVSIEIEAPADQLYDLVTNVTNMGRWSPETHRTEWLDGADRAVPGARFKGWNRTKVRGLPASWSTTCTVRQADRPRAFSFDTPMSGARWTYRFEPTGDGTSTRVTETREEVAHPWSARLLWAVIGDIRRRQLRDGMEVTLQRLKEAAEGTGTA